MSSEGRKVTLSVIVPVYNEVETVETVIDALLAIEEVTEILVVNDASSDGTKEILDKLENPRVRVFHHETNKGKGAGIRTAQQHLSCDVVVIQDADLEYSPQELPKLLRPIAEDKADIVYGSRYSGSELLVDTFWHYMGNKILTTFSNLLSNLHLTDMETCYKIMRTDIFRKIDIECNCFGFEPELTAKLAKMNCRIYEVPISYNARRFDEGKKIGWRDGVKAFIYIVKFNLFR